MKLFNAGNRHTLSSSKRAPYQFLDSLFTAYAEGRDLADVAVRDAARVSGFLALRTRH
jgi:hypothetical protein